MLKAAEGIIISEVNYGEKSKIINVLTKDGILGVMCKGAKSLKSPLRTSTMKFNLSSFLLYYHENGLSTLKECDVICDYKNIKSDILLISYMSYICDLAAGVMRQNENEEIYNLLISTLSKIMMDLLLMFLLIYLKSRCLIIWALAFLWMRVLSVVIQKIL